MNLRERLSRSQIVILRSLFRRSGGYCPKWAASVLSGHRRCPKWLRLVVAASSVAIAVFAGADFAFCEAVAPTHVAELGHVFLVKGIQIRDATEQVDSGRGVAGGPYYEADFEIRHSGINGNNHFRWPSGWQDIVRHSQAIRGLFKDASQRKFADTGTHPKSEIVSGCFPVVANSEYGAPQQWLTGAAYLRSANEYISAQFAFCSLVGDPNERAGGLCAFPQGFDLLFKLAQLKGALQPFHTGVRLSLAKLAFAGPPQFFSGAPERPSEPRDGNGCQSCNSTTVAVKGFSEMPERDKNYVIGGAIFYFGLAGLIAYFCRRGEA